MQSFTRLNVNGLALVAALASFNDRAFLKQSFESNRESRRILFKHLNRLGIEYLDSQTNFVMHRIRGSLQTYIERMRSKGIFVGRKFPPMTNYCRISLGLPDETAFYCRKLESCREKGWI